MAWQINTPGQTPAGLPTVRPQKLSRLLGQNPKLCTESLTLGLLSLSLRPAWGTLQPLYLGPMATSGKRRALWGFSPFFYKSGSVLAPRLCPVEGKEGEREGKKEISTLLFSSWKIVVICSVFHLRRMEKNVEKFGEINLSALLGALALPCLPLTSPLPCSPGSLSHFSSGYSGLHAFGPGAGLGPFWGSGPGTILRLCCAGAGTGAGLGWAGTGLELGWAGTGPETGLELCWNWGWNWNWNWGWNWAGTGAGLGLSPRFALRVEGLGSHCDVIQELHSYRMISEALGTQLAEITDRVLSHWLPTARVRRGGRGDGGRRRREQREGVVCVSRAGGRHWLLPPLTVPGSPTRTQTLPGAAAM